MPHLAFLGHSSTDKPAVEAMAAGLRLRGVHYWLDSEQIGAGQNIPDAIRKGLDAASVVVAVIGIEGVRGKWQGLEIDEAIMLSIGDGKPIIPVQIEGATTLPTGLKRLRAIVFESGHDARALDELAAAIRATEKSVAPGESGTPAAESGAYEAFLQNFLRIARSKDVNLVIGPEVWTMAPAWTEASRKIIVEKAKVRGGDKWFRPSALSPPVELAALLLAIQELDRDVADAELNEVLKTLESGESLGSARLVARVSRRMREARPASVQVVLTTVQDLALERALLMEGLSFTRVVQDISRARLIVENYQHADSGYCKGGSAAFETPGTAPQADRMLNERRGREYWYCAETNPPEGEEPSGLTGKLVFRDRPAPVLYKFKGSLDVPGSCVLSTDQILDCVALTRSQTLIPSPILTSLEAKVPLFLGYYLCDLDLRLLRKTILRQLPRGADLIKFALSPEPVPGREDAPWGQDDIRAKLGPTLHDRLASDGYQTVFADVRTFLDDVIRGL